VLGHITGRLVEGSRGTRPGAQFDAAAVFRRNLRVCFVDDRLGIELRDRIGVETIMWESDFPHPDSTWPRSRQSIAHDFEGVSDEDRIKMTCTNAAKLYGFQV